MFGGRRVALCAPPFPRALCAPYRLIESNLLWFDMLTTNGINKLPFVRAVKGARCAPFTAVSACAVRALRTALPPSREWWEFFQRLLRNAGKIDLAPYRLHN